MSGGGTRSHVTPGLIAIRPDWLAREVEAAVEPDLPVIDPHHHLWDPPGARYLFDELRADLDCGHRVDATVYVNAYTMYRAKGPDALRPVGETEFAAGVAAMSESGAYGATAVCAGIVAYVDFALGAAVAPVIEAHRVAAGGRLRGFRGRTAWHPDPEIHKWGTDPDILARPETRAAVAAIARAGLVFDAFVHQNQLQELVQLCRAFPEMPVVIDHAGGPIGCGPYKARRAEMFAAWRDGIRALAELPNTHIKLSGFGMRFNGWDYHLDERPPSSDRLAEDWRPEVEACIEAFGPGRAMFASNFPVDKAMFGYATMWNAFKKLTRGMGAGERTALLSATAARVYAIAPGG